MAQLSYKTRKNTSIYGIPKVYFCCHREDFEATFEDISNELLAKQNCSIWHHGKEDIHYTDEIFESLSQMHLFVIPVTDRFLTEGNPALETEFRFAVEHNIPVLPLMQQSGLESRFNRLCGNIQYLDKYSNDSTCIEYSDKLEKFLDCVLLGDEMIQKIRDAFDAYIFLSYRKKDRHHAQTLMKLIHQNDFCRDIAIWYDEFLVPGENFNEAISDALKKSKLFLLTVTPNLVNENNYIMDVEFPMAKQEGKPILPCEMVSTDRVSLEQMFQDLPACADIQDLPQRLRQHFLSIATQERDSSPEHLFFIGLAYLNGIDVEVNRDYALKLITASAEQGLSEAIEQLINMYTNGIGVGVDHDEAYVWHKMLVAVNGRKYEQAQDYDSALNYIVSYLQLAQACYDLDRYTEAMKNAEELKEICMTAFATVKCTQMEAWNIQRHTALADLLLGRIHHATSRLEQAKKHYEQSAAMFEWLNDKLEDPFLLRETAILYNYIAQLCKVKAEYAEALDYYEKALRLQQYNAQLDGGEDHLLDQVLTLVRMSESRRLTWDCSGSTQNCLTALEILDALSVVRGTRHYLGLKLMTMLALGESYRMMNDLTSALQVYENMIPVEEEYLQHYGDTAMDIRVRRMAKTVQIYYTMEDAEAVIQYGEQTIALLNHTSLLKDSNLAMGGAECSSLYLFVALTYYNWRNDAANGLKYMTLAVKEADHFMEQRITCNIPDVVMIYSTYGDMLQLCGEMDKANYYLEKAADIYENNMDSSELFRDVTCGYALYVTLGRSQMNKEELSAAIETFQKAEQLYHRAIALHPVGEEVMRKDYAQLCGIIGSCFLETYDPRWKEYYQKCMDIFDQIPEENYLLADWNTIGIVSYQMYNLSGKIFKSKKWKMRLLDAAYKIQKRFPEDYQQTYFYESLRETGVFQ